MTRIRLVLPLFLLEPLTGCTIENKPTAVGVEHGETGETGEETACEPTAEVCDGVDNDCDGEIDEDASDLGTWYEDADLDGYGAAPVQACEQPAGSVDNSLDCDDDAPAVHPEAPELCNAIDDDCDDLVDADDDDLADGLALYADADGDGWGDPDTPLWTCNPDDGVEDFLDCDDADPAISPDAPELCNDLDDDCDDRVDTADDDLEDGLALYADADGDGYGDPDVPLWTCDPDDGVDNADDCDDEDPAVHPDAPELCNDLDDDCDDLVDAEDTDLLDGLVLYADADGDGYGDPDAPLWTCDPDDGVDNTDDCDDEDAGISPEAEDVCNGIDDDCDGVVDPADCECGGDAPEGLNVVITDSTLETSGYTMSTYWSSVATGMGFSVSMVGLSTLATSTALDDADILIVSSGVSSGFSSTITANVLSFIESGGSVYLQTEYSCSYPTNLAFTSLLTDLGASFSWVGTVSGDIGSSLVPSGCLSESPDTFSGMDYYWYGCEGTGIDGFLTYGTKDVAFQYCPDDSSMGQIITTTDQDWVRTASGSDLVLMGNILNALATNPLSCP